MIGDATLHSFEKPMTKIKPRSELFPICKVEEYAYGKVQKTYWTIKKPDGEELLFPSYAVAEEYQRENKR